jgi:hypothetical protein
MTRITKPGTFTTSFIVLLGLCALVECAHWPVGSLIVQPYSH